MNNKLVQNIFTAAINHLTSVIDGVSVGEQPKMFLLYSYLQTVATYSKSGNNIAGLSGLGLEESVRLANWVNETKPVTDRDILIYSYKPIGDVLLHQ